MASDETRIVLITGCSNNSLGSALALAFREHGGYKVLATARSKDHMTDLPIDIGKHELDVTTDSSIQALVKEVSAITSGKLDILINSVGGGHYMPFYHLDISKAKA